MKAKLRGRWELSFDCDWSVFLVGAGVTVEQAYPRREITAHLALGPFLLAVAFC